MKLDIYHNFDAYRTDVRGGKQYATLWSVLLYKLKDSCMTMYTDPILAWCAAITRVRNYDKRVYMNDNFLPLIGRISSMAVEQKILLSIITVDGARDESLFQNGDMRRDER